MENKEVNLKVISSLSEYIDVTSAIAVEEHDSVWFRGHSSAAYRLVPTALRDAIPLRSALGYRLSGKEFMTSGGNTVTGLNPERMLADFKRRARPFLGFLPRNDFEWMFIMQHHGVPTRLLDWTSNALVALYFAVSGLVSGVHKTASDADDEEWQSREFRDDAAAVYVMNPRRMNDAFHPGVQDPVDVAEHFERWSPYADPMSGDSLSTYGPICITAPQVSPRIRAQAGLFTLHGSNIWALDYYEALRPLLTKLLIPYDAALAIQSQLHHFGITESFIFPDLDGVAREVRAAEVRRFKWERHEHLTAQDDE
jgi:hypothetical protein